MSRKLVLIVLFLAAAIVVGGVYLAVRDGDGGGISVEDLPSVEIREYEGVNLSSIADFRENSIKGPQYIGLDNYRLKVTGLVANPGEYTVDEVIAGFQSYRKVVKLHCVEGWSVTILWEGLLVEDLVERAQALPEANTVIFHAYDGYTTSLPLDYIVDQDILMAHKMNDVVLPPQRGAPFQLVAESKLGYKWIKWITEIELSDDADYRGYWERRGYSNDADLR
jgi:DMSO/TMAO reductase YedYZ molybdopterin-dependent catalytic subunit